MENQRVGGAPPIEVRGWHGTDRAWWVPTITSALAMAVCAALTVAGAFDGPAAGVTVAGFAAGLLISQLRFRVRIDHVGVHVRRSRDRTIPWEAISALVVAATPGGHRRVAVVDDGGVVHVLVGVPDPPAFVDRAGARRPSGSPVPPATVRDVDATAHRGPVAVTTSAWAATRAAAPMTLVTALVATVSVRLWAEGLMDARYLISSLAMLAGSGAFAVALVVQLRTGLWADASALTCRRPVAVVRLRMDEVTGFHRVADDPWLGSAVAALVAGEVRVLPLPRIGESLEVDDLVTRLESLRTGSPSSIAPTGKDPFHPAVPAAWLRRGVPIVLFALAGAMAVIDALDRAAPAWPWAVKAGAVVIGFYLLFRCNPPVAPGFSEWRTGRRRG